MSLGNTSSSKFGVTFDLVSFKVHETILDMVLFAASDVQSTAGLEGKKPVTRDYESKEIFPAVDLDSKVSNQQSKCSEIL